MLRLELEVLPEETEEEDPSVTDGEDQVSTRPSSVTTATEDSPEKGSTPGEEEEEKSLSSFNGTYTMYLHV